MMNNRWQDAIVFLSGAGTVLAFAPIGFFPLAILLPAVLFNFWANANARRAAALGFFYGLGLFGAGASWVYVSIHEFGYMPAPMAAVLVLLFVAYLSLYPALAGWVQARFFRNSNLRLLFGVPVLWSIGEWARGWVLTGFPWLNLGYSQTEGPIMNLAPLVGVYGMSLAVAVLAALLAAIYRFRGRRRLFAAGGMAVIVLLSQIAGMAGFTRVAGDRISVAIVQGNVPLDIKWKAGAAGSVIGHHLALSRNVVEQSQLIIWPEGAVPDTWQRTAKAIMPLLPRRSDNSSPDYLFGAVDEPSAQDKSAGQVYYNAAIAVTDVDGQRTVSLYRKVHLVPFGEFLPLRPLMGWLIDYLKIPMSNFSAWKAEQAGIILAGAPAAINICYEDAFGEELLGAARASDFMVNISEDAWFGDSLAPHQRLQMAQVRAREFGRYFVRAANTGVTAVINERGVVIDRLDQFKTAVLTSKVLPLEGVTPYAKYGNVLFLVLCIFWVLPAVLLNRSR